MRKVFLCLFFILFFSPCFASFFKADNNLIISSSTDVLGNVYLAGNNVVINRVINGDVLVLGNSIEVNGVINGDLMVIGSSVSVNANVTGDVRAFGGIVSINGFVGNELLSGAGTFLINEGSSVGELNAMAGDALIAGLINGNATLRAENITVSSTALINGFLNYTSSNDAIIEDSSVINGFVQKNVPESSNAMPGNLMTKSFTPLWSFAWASTIISILSMLLTGYVLVRLSSKTVKEYKVLAGKDYFNLLIKGFAFLVLVPIAVIIGLITVIAAPISMVVLGIYAIIMYIACVLIGFPVGSKVLSYLRIENKSLMTELFIGILILELLNMVPLIGWFIKLIIVLIGAGALINTLSEKLSECKTKKIF